MNMFNSFISMRRIGGMKEQATKILSDSEKSDQDKLTEILGLEFLK